MAFIREQGFILQPLHVPGQQVAVLTKSRGKLNMVIKLSNKQAHLSAGSRIDFTIGAERFLIAYDIEVISVPFVQSQRDIVWVHHWLELISYFSQPELFDERLFKSLELYLMLLLRKALFNDLEMLGLICVFHCLQQTGFYEDYLFLRHKKIMSTISFLCYQQDFDEILHSLAQSVNNLTINEIKQIEFFILQCLQKSPFFTSLKTLRFAYAGSGLRNKNYGI